MQDKMAAIEPAVVVPVIIDASQVNALVATGLLIGTLNRRSAEGRVQPLRRAAGRPVLKFGKGERDEDGNFTEVEICLRGMAHERLTEKRRFFVADICSNAGGRPQFGTGRHASGTQDQELSSKSKGAVRYTSPPRPG